jgi:hypothetical protein
MKSYSTQDGQASSLKTDYALDYISKSINADTGGRQTKAIFDNDRHVMLFIPASPASLGQ